MHGSYKLHVGSESIRLLKHDSDREVMSWPLTRVRNFGTVERGFFIYAGTRCKSGEGKFVFITPEKDAILQEVIQQTELIRRKFTSVRKTNDKANWDCDMYAHLHQQGPSTAHYNVYGMGSASASFNLSDEECPYANADGSPVKYVRK